MSRLANDSSTDASTEDEGPTIVQSVARLVPVRYECKWVKMVSCILARYMIQEFWKSWPMLIEIFCPTPKWQCYTYPTALKLLGKKGKVALKNQELPENGSSARLRCFLGVLRGEFLPRAPRYYWKYEFQAIDSDEEAGYAMLV